MTIFQDRSQAGRELAWRLSTYADRPGALVLGLPRGGVPVAAEVAAALHLPLDVLVVRKLGVPGHEELAMGAVAAGGVRVLNDAIVRQLAIKPHTLERVTEVERAELLRREGRLRGGLQAVRLRGRVVVLVDDGVATGATMRSAVAAVRAAGAARVVAATPLASPEAEALLRHEADEVVCLQTPDPFVAVGHWYQHFPQTEDEEVRALLQEAEARAAREAGEAPEGGTA